MRRAARLGVGAVTLAERIAVARGEPVPTARRRYGSPDQLEPIHDGRCPDGFHAHVFREPEWVRRSREGTLRGKVLAR